MTRFLKTLIAMTAMVSLSACVTQNYEEDDTPVLENESSDSEIALTRISLGLGYLKMGNTSQAKFNLEKAKKYAPNMVQVYSAFAHYYETVGEDALTVQSYEHALSLDPNDANTLNNYGVFLCRKERLDEAEVQFLKAIKVPTYIRVSESYENLALCQLEAFNFEKAEHYLEKAIAHSPSSGSALLQMMRLQYAIGEYVTAKDYGKRFEKASRRFSSEYMALAYKVYLKLGDTRTANNYGTMLVKMYPDSWHAKQYLLNRLDSIDADDLATQYQILVSKTQSQSVNKRVVVLSPDKDKAPIVFSKKKKYKPKSRQSAVYTIPKESTQGTTSSQPQQNQPPVVKTAKPTRVLKAPQVQSSKVVASEQNSSGTDSAVLTAEQQIAHLESITDETEQLEQQSTDALIAEISRHASEYDAEAEPDPVLDDGMLSDESIDAVLAEAEALIENDETLAELSREYDQQLALEQAENAQTESTPYDVEALSSTDELVSQLESHTDGNLSTTMDSEQQEEIVSADSNAKANTTEKIRQEVIYHQIEDLPTHEMADGENLFTVSKRYNIHLHALKEWNKLDERSLVRVGDKIYLADPRPFAVGNE
ncbi:type IV pilus biogenesis/stability protein PilW [Thalassotalea atypica]|uniref:type IV pilus biogenesis/stability protein PilW n=1 Tax=Thalassotalea atypica TaxID=2054316 RepID=UPI0025725789|nr:type IV pilus biogenesis/stability protein PilW [Thalassotalea atypica]